MNIMNHWEAACNRAQCFAASYLVMACGTCEPGLRRGQWDRKMQKKKADEECQNSNIMKRVVEYLLLYMFVKFLSFFSRLLIRRGWLDPEPTWKVLVCMFCMFFTSFAFRGLGFIICHVFCISQIGSHFLLLFFGHLLGPKPNQNDETWQWTDTPIEWQ